MVRLILNKAIYLAQVVSISAQYKRLDVDGLIVSKGASIAVSPQ